MHPNLRFYLIILLINLSQYSLSSAQENEIKILTEQLKKASGKERVDAWNQLADIYKLSSPDLALNYGDSAMQMSLKINYKIGWADANANIGAVQFLAQNVDLSLNYFIKAQKIYLASKIYTKLARALNNIGEVYLDKYQRTKKNQYLINAKQYFQEGLTYVLKHNDQTSIAYNYISLANWHLVQDNLDSAQYYYEKSLQISGKLKDYDAMSRAYINLSYVAESEGDEKEAFNYLFKGLDFAHKSDFINTEAFALNKLAETYLNRENFDSAYFYVNKSLKVIQKSKPFSYLEEQRAFEILHDFHLAKGNADSVKVYFQVHKENLNDRNKVITKAALDFLHQEEIIQEQVVRQSKIIQLIMGILLILASIFLIYVIFSIRKQKQINRELADKKKKIEGYAQDLEVLNTQVNLQKDELLDKKKKIDDSINFGLLIQQASLPLLQDIRRIIPELFVFYVPLDVVSGDFYWFAQTEVKPVFTQIQDFPDEKTVLKGFENEKSILVVADCTGHGIPGAFMSMIGNTLLHEAVYVLNLSSPGQIIQHVYSKVKDILRQDQLLGGGGMEIAVCVVDSEKKQLTYSGAGISLILAQDGNVEHIKGDKVSLNPDKHLKEFSEYTFSVNEGSSMNFYMHSDGFIHQFGGDSQKKLSTKRLLEWVKEYHLLPMPIQSEKFEEAFYEWKGEKHQIDDVTLLGFRI